MSKRWVLVSAGAALFVTTAMLIVKVVWKKRTIKA